MKILYMSLTGQVKKFVNKIDCSNLEITLDNSFQEIKEPFILISPTYDEEATFPLFDFLSYKDNQKHCLGVIGSGNKNFNTLYCFTAKKISKDFNIPYLMDFEFQGTQVDVEKFKKIVEKIDIEK